MYKGIYNGSSKHQPDLKEILDRSFKCGLDKLIITGGSLAESRSAIELAKENGKFHFIQHLVHSLLNAMPVHIHYY